MLENDPIDTREHDDGMDPDLSPTEDLVYDEGDWNEDSLVGGLIDEDMVREIAAQLARATAGDRSEVVSRQEDDGGEAWAEEIDEEEGADHYDDSDRAAEWDEDDEEDDENSSFTRKDLDGSLKNILGDDGSEDWEEGLDFSGSPLDAGSDRRVLERYGPPTAGLGLVILASTLAIAYTVGMIVQEGAVYFLSPVVLTVALTVLLGSFTYFLCRIWFKQSWEQRSHVIDTAAAVIFDLELKPLFGPDGLKKLVDESTTELYSRVRSELDEREEKLRTDTQRDVQKMRIFFESLLEKHVMRTREDLREKSAEVERLRLQQQDGEKIDAELTDLRSDNERLKDQPEELEMELDQVDKDRRLKEDELEDFRLQLEVGKKELEAGAEAGEQRRLESESEKEELRNEVAALQEEIDSGGDESKRLIGEIENLVHAAKETSQQNSNLFDKVSGQFRRNLQLASKLVTQFGRREAKSEFGSDSSVTSEICGHLASLERLITQVTDLGKLQSSTWRTVYTEVKIKDLLDETVEKVRAEADRTGVKLSVKAPKELPTIRTDRRMVSRALHEVIANAVIYTKHGGRVNVRATLEEGDSETDVLCIAVQDSGRGITHAELKNIFEPFERGMHPRVSLSGAGAGLGLALAKGYTEKLGGEIEVESKHGKGSTFTIKVPVEEVG